MLFHFEYGNAENKFLETNSQKNGKFKECFCSFICLFLLLLLDDSFMCGKHFIMAGIPRYLNL